MRKKDFKGPHPVYRMMLMTDLFGPVGYRWGIDQVDWNISAQEASVCVVVWWTDGVSGKRGQTTPTWGKTNKIDEACMSVAVDAAVDAAIAQIEPRLPVRTIPLSQGYAAIVDTADYDRVASHLWSVLKTTRANYACRGFRKDGRQVMALMHREIMAAPDDMQVDHRNHNGLDNRRTNLRICTNQQNIMNPRRRAGSSRFKGVSLNKRLSKWSAQIMVDGRKKHLGFFLEEMDAATAYDAAAKIHYGDFANLNFKE